MPKRDSKYRINIADLPFSPINHGSVQKKVFVANDDNNTDLTQFAYSKFDQGSSCEEHSHPSMDEYFFILSGKGEYIIGNEAVMLIKGDFIKIPAGVRHKIDCDNNGVLEIIYFGISTENNK